MLVIWSLSGFAIICVVVLSCSAPNYNSAEWVAFPGLIFWLEHHTNIFTNFNCRFVFRGFVNQTGWPDGVAWLLGLLQGGLGVTGFDAVAHMIEGDPLRLEIGINSFSLFWHLTEIPNPSETGPQIMIACVGIGTITGSLFLVVLLFVAGNISEIIDSAATPLLAILSRATGNTPGAICLLMWETSECILHIIVLLTRCKVPHYLCSFCGNSHHDDK